MALAAHLGVNAMDTNDEIELGNYWRIFRRSWWMIALAVLSMTALALVFLPAQQNFFNSEVSVLLKPGDADVGQGNDPIIEETEIGIITSPVIGSLVVANEAELDLEVAEREAAALQAVELAREHAADHEELGFELVDRELELGRLLEVVGRLGRRRRCACLLYTSPSPRDS